MLRDAIRKDRTPGRNGYSIHLRTQEFAKQVTVGAVNQVTDIIQWTGPSVWRLTASAERIDVFAEAKEYFDVANRQMSLRDAADRVVGNLAVLPEELGAKVKRLACIAKYEASEDQCSSPAKFVARRFFNESIQSHDTLIDLAGRVNFGKRGVVSSLPELLLNRIETGEAKWALKDGQVAKSLAWQYDCNTSPEFSGPLTKVQIQEFFAAAVEWIETSHEGLFHDA